VIVPYSIPCAVDDVTTTGVLFVELEIEPDRVLSDTTDERSVNVPDASSGAPPVGNPMITPIDVP
jgi:hypothetical protein